MISRILGPALAVCLVFAFLSDSADAQGRRGRGGFGRFAANDLVVVVAMPEVQRELGLEDEQERLLEALLGDLRQQQRELFRRGPIDPDDGESPQDVLRRRLERLSQGSEQLVAVVLEPDQMKRLNQLVLQYQGPRALERDEVVKELELTEEQRERIAQIRRRSFGNPRSRSGRGEEDSGQDWEEALRAELTSEQVAKWQEMQGERFEFPEEPSRFGQRGFPGPFGRGGQRD